MIVRWYHAQMRSLQRNKLFAAAFIGLAVAIAPGMVMEAAEVSRVVRLILVLFMIPGTFVGIVFFRREFT